MTGGGEGADRAREDRLALPGDPVAEEGSGFTARVVAEEPAPAPVDCPAPGSAVEIVSEGIVIRLDGATSGVWIAGIAPAPGARFPADRWRRVTPRRVRSPETAA